MRLATLLLLVPGVALAAPVPTCDLAVHGPVLVGEDAAVSLVFGNAGDAPGYLPTVHVDLPAGTTIAMASAFGVPLDVVTSGATAAIGLPLTDLPAGDGVEVALVVHADGGAPRSVGASCRFDRGATPDDDSGVDPVLAASDTVSLDPEPMVFTKAWSVDHTATGPSHPVEILLSVDVATGARVTGLELTDPLPDAFVTTGLDADLATILSVPPETGGGEATVRYPSIVGGPGVDRTVRITGYFQETVDGAPVIDPMDPRPVDVGNDAVASGGRWGEGSVAAVTAAAPISLHGALITERLIPDRAVVPGDVLDICVDLAVSDYLTVEAGTLDVRLAPGLDLCDGTDPGVCPDTRDASFVLYTPSVGGSLARLVQRTPAQSGGTEAVCATVRVEPHRSDGLPVLPGDILSTSHRWTTAIIGGASVDAAPGDVDADRTITVAGLTLDKEVVAINGAPASAGAIVRPGDTVTYGLTVTLPGGSAPPFVVRDVLPRPVFDATQHGVSPTVRSSCASPCLRYGPGHDPDLAAVATASAADNTLELAFGSTTGTGTRAAVVYVDFTVTHDAFADDVAFVNRAFLGEVGAAAALSLAEPEVHLVAGAVELSGSRGSIVPAPNGFPYTADGLAADPEDGDAVGLEADDALVLHVIAYNAGRADALDVDLAWALPETLVATGAVEVLDGRGAPRPATVGPGTVTLTTPLSPPTTDGSDVAVVRVPVAVVDSYTPGERGVAVGRLLGYGSLAQGGAGYDEFVVMPVEDTVRIDLRDVVVRKRLTAPGPFTIGEPFEVEVEVDVPEGTFPAWTLVDALPPELALVAAPDPVAVAGGLPVPGVASIAPDGSRATWSIPAFGNTDRDTNAETWTITYDAVVLDVPTAQHGERVVNRFEVAQGGTVLAADTLGTTIAVPAVTVDLTAVPASDVDAGDTVVFEACVAPVSGRPPPEEVWLRVEVPSEAFGDVAVAGSMGRNGSPSVVDGGVEASWPDLEAGQSPCVSLSATALVAVTPGQVVTGTAEVRWTTRDGDPPVASVYTAAAVERTGADGVGGALDDLARRATAEVRVRPLAAANTATGDGTATIGTRVTWDLVFDVPEGTTGTVVLEDQLPAGVVFEEASALSASEGLTCAGGPCVLGAPDVSADGRTVSWTLEGLANAAADPDVETLAVSITGVVANVAGNVRGRALVNRASLGPASAASAPVVIVEPSLATSVSLATGEVDAGDTVRATLSVAPTSESDAPAHDVAVGLTLAGGFTWAGGLLEDCGVDGAPVIAGQTVALRVPSVAAPCTVAFDVVVDGDVAPLDALGVDTTATWTSLPGDVDQERGPEGGYTAVASAVASVPGVAVTKALDGTTFEESAGHDLLLGEIATWTLAVTLPESTSDVVITEAPPPGMRILSAHVDPGFGGSVTTSDFPDVDGASGEALPFDLGTVVVTGNNDAGDDVLVLRVEAEVVSDPAAARDAENAARVDAGPASAADTAPVRYRWPDLRVSASVDDDTLDRGQSFALVAVLENIGDGPACDVRLALALPEDIAADGSTANPVEVVVNGCVFLTPVEVPIALEVASTLISGERELVLTGLDYRTAAGGGVVGVPDPAFATAKVTVVVGDLDDLDGDGLTNAEEEAIGSDPLVIDTDGDGLTDLQERDAGLDPTRDDTDRDGLSDDDPRDPDPWVRDVDGDGLADGEEIVVLGTDPARADSDGDGWDDGHECRRTRTDPLAADSDGDGIDDPDERGTDPLLADTDGDGLIDGDPDDPEPTVRDRDRGGVPDGVEVERGTDPLDPTDDVVLPNTTPARQDPEWPADRDRDGLLDADDPWPDAWDGDADGLADGFEVRVVGTDPAVPDTDNGGISDGMEFWLDATDPTDGGDDALRGPDEGPDADVDGVADDREVAVGTDASVADTDGDGLDDGAEVALGTDPTWWDTDGDGVSDGAEVARGTDPFGHPRFDATTDTDGDGLSDWDERRRVGTSPTRADTDGDGLSDADELDRGLAPTLRDTDADRIPDGTEVLVGSDPADPDDAPPRAPDTDGDGLTDDDEAALGTDPLAIDPDGDGLSDAEEAVVFGTDPAVADAPSDERFVPDPGRPAPQAGVDTDGDGVLDADEIAAGTDPMTRDTDGDGLLDGEETDTDPLVADGDTDGLSDGVEVLVTGTDPGDPDADGDGLTDGVEWHVVGSDPSRLDTDDGGEPDGEEVALGRDPLDPLDDFDVRYAGGCDGCASSAGPGGWVVLLVPLVVLLRRRGVWAGLVIAGAASAQEVPDSPNLVVPELAAQAYRPTADGQATLWTDDAGTVEAGWGQAARLVAGWVDRPLVVRWSDIDGDHEAAVVGGALQVDAVAVVQWTRVRVAVDLPAILTATSDLTDSGGGIGDLSLDGRVGAIDGVVGVAASGRLTLPTATVSAPVGTPAGKPTWELAAVADLDVGPVLLAANVGYRGVPRVQLRNVAWTDALVVRAAAAVRLGDIATVAAEVAGSAALGARTAPQPTRGAGTPLEGLLSSRIALGPTLHLDVGGGAGLTPGLGSPRFRVLGGLSWRPAVTGPP